jgi:hypothetical protein
MGIPNIHDKALNCPPREFGASNKNLPLFLPKEFVEYTHSLPPVVAHI